MRHWASRGVSVQFLPRKMWFLVILLMMTRDGTSKRCNTARFCRWSWFTTIWMCGRPRVVFMSGLVWHFNHRRPSIARDDVCDSVIAIYRERPHACALNWTTLCTLCLVHGDDDAFLVKVDFVCYKRIIDCLWEETFGVWARSQFGSVALFKWNAELHLWMSPF